MNTTDDSLSTSYVSSTPYRELLIRLMHELRELIYIIKSNSEIISKSISEKNIDRQALEFHADEIFKNTYLMSLLIDMVDYELNPEFFYSQKKNLEVCMENLKKLH